MKEKANLNSLQNFIENLKSGQSSTFCISWLLKTEIKTLELNRESNLHSFSSFLKKLQVLEIN